VFSAQNAPQTVHELNFDSRFRGIEASVAKLTRMMSQSIVSLEWKTKKYSFLIYAVVSQKCSEIKNAPDLFLIKDLTMLPSLVRSRLARGNPLPIRNPQVTQPDVRGISRHFDEWRRDRGRWE